MSGVMLVTGASRGIGAEVALQAARAGFKVAVNYLNSESAAQQVVEQITDQGGQAMALRADVGRQDEVRHMFARLDDAFGPLDVLVNNAGVLEVLSISDADEVSLDRNYRANVFSFYYCAREAVRRMSTQHGGKGGAIVNLSSVASRLGGLGVAYAGAKGAIDAFNLALAKEVAGQGIRVNAVRPGLISTSIHDASGGMARMHDLAKTAVPLGRAGSAKEVAQAVLWLSSDDASYVNGTLLDVAGGR
jgi:NAD(P)-dependent dehydrogenase (short-subunit alcohol dehydrogenase family)